MRLVQIILCITFSSSAVTAADYPITAKIIGGQTASSTAWPWMAALSNKSLTAISGLFCGGSLIAQNWVLTAAHCMFDNKNQLETPQNLRVQINSANLNSITGEVHNVAEIHVHPAFNQTNLNNDLALLKLSENSNVTPIEILPANSSQDEAGQNSIALGWGNTSTRRIVFPADLHQVALPIISNAVCSRALTGIIDSMVCAGQVTGGVDTCEGDSGGPLLVFDQESQSYRQAAITSFGESKCAAPGFYGVYTRVDQFNDFISNTICSAEQIPTAPQLKLTVNKTLVQVSWNKVLNGQHFRLNYAPYPTGTPIASMEMHQKTEYAVNLPLNSAYYVAITAYNGNCKSGYSNVETFVVR